MLASASVRTVAGSSEWTLGGDPIEFERAFRLLATFPSFLILLINPLSRNASMDFAWLDGIGAAVTVCDHEGIVVYMNETSARTFEKDGGKALVGQSLWACHPEAANVKMRQMMKDGASNTYTIEKNGAKKFLWQTPWMVEGVCKGLVEVAIPIPFEMPHFVRDKPQG
jgi:hypothetical protein